MGQVVTTRSINDLMAAEQKFAVEVTAALQRFAVKNWGNMDAEDKQTNEDALNYPDDLYLMGAYNTSKGRCALCGRKITYDNMTLEHIVPLAMNGADDVSNLQCTCEACNLFKGSVLPDDFMERITEIFLYQMDRKESKRLLWKFVHKI